jgi:hypothetical protein
MAMKDEDAALLIHGVFLSLSAIYLPSLLSYKSLTQPFIWASTQDAPSAQAHK